MYGGTKLGEQKQNFYFNNLKRSFRGQSTALK
jgi:hypothetical protein